MSEKVKASEYPFRKVTLQTVQYDRMECGHELKSLGYNKWRQRRRCTLCERMVKGE